MKEKRECRKNCGKTFRMIHLINNLPLIVIYCFRSSTKDIKRNWLPCLKLLGRRGKMLIYNKDLAFGEFRSKKYMRMYIPFTFFLILLHSILVNAQKNSTNIIIGVSLPFSPYTTDGPMLIRDNIPAVSTAFALRQLAAKINSDPK